MALDLGYEDESNIIGKTDIELFGEEFGRKTIEDDTQVMTSGEPIVGMIESYVNKQGKINWTSTTKLPLHDDSGAVVGLLGITREINELKQSEQDFQRLATHDQLTSLPNRFLLMDRMNQAILNAKRTQGVFAVLFIDLNKFKLVNDKYGHEKGDQLLVEVALVLSSTVRRSDMVARYGGDEFVILLEGLKKAEDSVLVAKKIANLVRSYFEAMDIAITISIGISLYPMHSEDVETLIHLADQAMYEAKLNQSGCKLAVI